MPQGIDADQFQEMLIALAGEDLTRDFMKWFTETYPSWARLGWQRLDRARGTPPCP